MNNNERIRKLKKVLECEIKLREHYIEKFKDDKRLLEANEVALQTYENIYNLLTDNISLEFWYKWDTKHENEYW